MNYIRTDLADTANASLHDFGGQSKKTESKVDAYFSADIETDGPIPGPFSILSFALVYAGSYDGKTFRRPNDYRKTFYRELKPISENFQIEALEVNGLDRDALAINGLAPEVAMHEAYEWVVGAAGGGVQSS